MSVKTLAQEPSGRPINRTVRVARIPRGRLVRARQFPKHVHEPCPRSGTLHIRWALHVERRPRGARGGPRSAGAGARAGPPAPPPSHTLPDPDSSLSPARSALPWSRVSGRRPRGVRTGSQDTHLGPWRRRWLQRGPPLPRDAQRAAQAPRHNGWFRGRGRDNRPRLSPRPPSQPRQAPRRRPLRARAVLTNRSAERQQPGPQRPLPARSLQPANRQVPALLFRRVRLAPAPKSGPYSSLCSRGSATPLSSPAQPSFVSPGGSYPLAPSQALRSLPSRNPRDPSLTVHPY